MTYIKLLTVLVGLALLTACGGATPTDDKAGGGTGGNTTNCTTNPFHADCSADADFATARLTICMGESTSARCDTTINPICELDFNNALCRGRAKYDDLLCASIPTCADGVVNTADWLAGFDAPLNTAGDRDREEIHEFLQGTADGLNAGNVIDFTAPPIVETLDLEFLGGEAKNGVAFFFGGDGATGIHPPVRLYSGIFSGTDLGAPLTSADASVSVPWAGTIIWSFFDDVSRVINAENNNRGISFPLTVDFANSEIRAFVKRGGAPAGNTDHFVLNAEFDDSGRFDGTVIHGAFAGNDKDATPTNVTNGVLTGLIGELGAVGVFISDETQAVSTDTDIAFVGGFVAISPKEVARIERERIQKAQELLESQVTFTDWIGGFDTEPPATPDVATQEPTHKNQFLAGTTTLDPLTTATPLTLTSTIGGVGFFTENGAFYAGLLSNTNVGLPVADTPQVDSADVTANWPGMIRAIGVFDGDANAGDTQTALELNVMVNFTARTFTATRTDPNASATSITINGLFPATDDGVVTGTVRQSSGNFHRDGQLTGVIGADGVVGAFYSDSNVAVVDRYVGGFYAAPSAN